VHSTPCFTLFCTSFVSLDSTHGVIHMSLYTIQSITGSPERSFHRVPVIRPQSRIRCCLRWTGHGEHVVLWGYKYDGCSPAYHRNHHHRSLALPVLLGQSSLLIPITSRELIVKLRKSIALSCGPATSFGPSNKNHESTRRPRPSQNPVVVRQL